jgi:peptide/nickel transport system ATP-binding protein
MYRGAVVEAGSVARVIREPKHPYTQLLVDSIPQMRAVRNWARDEEEAPPRAAEEPRVSTGCKFADRCPAVMAHCWNQKPPLYQVDAERVARCFLYQDKPVLKSANVAETFVA